MRTELQSFQLKASKIGITAWCDGKYVGLVNVDGQIATITIRTEQFIEKPKQDRR